MAENAIDMVKDIAVRERACSPENPMRFKAGEYVKFGTYPESHGDTKDPIEWLVLEVKDNEALLVSRYGLDCKRHCRYFTNLT